jgi:hypothetical protein
MLKKTITFTDFNGVERSEDLYFHVSKASVLTAEDSVYNEIMELGQKLEERSKLLLATEEDLIDKEPLVDDEDPFSERNQLLAESVRMVGRLLDRLVDLSYGVRSKDGSRFVKGPEVLQDFKQSAVYDAFVEHMITHQKEMLDFINRLLQN